MEKIDKYRKCPALNLTLPSLEKEEKEGSMDTEKPTSTAITFSLPLLISRYNLPKKPILFYLFSTFGRDNSV